MTRDDAKLQRQLDEINARFQRHERMTRWIMAGVILLVGLVLVLLTNLLLMAEGAL